MKSNRSSILAAIAISILAFSVSSFAKDNNGNNPTNPASASASGGNGYAGAIAGSVSASGSVASSNSSVYGSQQSYDANNIDISTGAGNSRALGIAFAAPAYTQVPAAAGCARTNSNAISIVFGFISHSQSVQSDSRLCIMMQMRDRAHEACQFKSAAQWDYRIFKELFPNEEAPAVDAELKNYSAEICHPDR